MTILYGMTLKLTMTMVMELILVKWLKRSYNKLVLIYKIGRCNKHKYVALSAEITTPWR